MIGDLLLHLDDLFGVAMKESVRGASDSLRMHQTLKMKRSPP